MVQRSERLSMGMTTATRIVLAKIGLDGHDRGIKVVARGLRDEGFHVIYAGLWQSLEAVVKAVADEDAGWLGLSLLSGAHMTLVPRLLELLRQAGLADVGVLVGGIIPEEDVRRADSARRGAGIRSGHGARARSRSSFGGQGMRGQCAARRARLRSTIGGRSAGCSRRLRKGKVQRPSAPLLASGTTRAAPSIAQSGASHRHHGQRRRWKEHADRQAHRRDSEDRPVGCGAGLRSAELSAPAVLCSVIASACPTGPMTIMCSCEVWPRPAVIRARCRTLIS